MTEQSVVDEDALQSIANRAMNEHRRDGRVHTAREATHHLALPDLLTNALRRLLDERADRPVAGAAAFAISEIPQDRDAVFRVHDFRVEQQRIQLPLGRFHRHDRRRGACCGHGKPRRHGPHIVTVARPHLEFARDLMKETRLAMRFRAAVTGNAHMRMPELTIARAAHFTAERARHELHSIADAEDRNSQVEEGRVTHWCALIRHAARSA